MGLAGVVDLGLGREADLFSFSMRSKAASAAARLASAWAICGRRATSPRRSGRDGRGPGRPRPGGGDGGAGLAVVETDQDAVAFDDGAFVDGHLDDHAGDLSADVDHWGRARGRWRRDCGRSQRVRRRPRRPPVRRPGGARRSRRQREGGGRGRRGEGASGCGAGASWCRPRLLSSCAARAASRSPFFVPHRHRRAAGALRP